MRQTKRIRIRDRSVETFKSYLTEHLWFGVVMGINVYELLPIIVPIAYLDRSIPRLILCMVGTGCVGILFTYRYNRSFWGVLMDTNLGLGMYVVLTVGKYSPAFIIWTLAATCAFTMLSLIRIWCRGIRKPDYRKQIILSRSFRGIWAIRRNMAILATVLMVVLPLSFRFFKTEALSEAYINQLQAMNDGTSEEIAVHQAYGDEYRMAENIDIIRLIRDNETFQNLSYRQKKEVAEAIIYCEARYLHLCKINVKFEDLGDDTWGVYNHAEKKISINKKLLQKNGMPGATAETVLKTCIHECKHVQQHLWVDMYEEATPEQRALMLFSEEEIDEWVKNFKQYSNPTEELEDYLLYYIQPVEKDARKYADEQVEIYYAEIDSLLAEQNSQ